MNILTTPGHSFKHLLKEPAFKEINIHDNYRVYFGRKAHWRGGRMYRNLNLNLAISRNPLLLCRKQAAQWLHAVLLLSGECYAPSFIWTRVLGEGVQIDSKMVALSRSFLFFGYL